LVVNIGLILWILFILFLITFLIVPCFILFSILSSAFLFFSLSQFWIIQGIWNTCTLFFILNIHLLLLLLLGHTLRFLFSFRLGLLRHRSLIYFIWFNILYKFIDGLLVELLVILLGSSTVYFGGFLYWRWTTIKRLLACHGSIRNYIARTWLKAQTIVFELRIEIWSLRRLFCLSDLVVYYCFLDDVSVWITGVRKSIHLSDFSLSSSFDLCHLYLVGKLNLFL
jgi:hypothetical protein